MQFPSVPAHRAGPSRKFPVLRAPLGRGEFPEGSAFAAGLPTRRPPRPVSD